MREEKITENTPIQTAGCTSMQIVLRGMIIYN